MIICLYDNPSYPIIRDKEPTWANLPMGYFNFDERQLRNVETEDMIKLSGTFIYAPYEGSIRPLPGDHVLVAFSYKRSRYLINATLTYLYSWVDHPLKKQCYAHLAWARSNLIRRW